MKIDEIVEFVVEPKVLGNGVMTVVRVHVDVDIVFQCWIVDETRERDPAAFYFKVVSFFDWNRGSRSSIEIADSLSSERGMAKLDSPNYFQLERGRSGAIGPNEKPLVVTGAVRVTIATAGAVRGRGFRVVQGGRAKEVVRAIDSWQTVQRQIEGAEAGLKFCKSSLLAVEAVVDFRGDADDAPPRANHHDRE